MVNMVKKIKLTDHKEIFFLVCFIAIGYFFLYYGNGFIGDFGDPIGQTIPNKVLVASLYKANIFPLWNPFTFLGFPLLADPQAGALYFPDIVLFGNYPPLQAHNISVLFHLFLGSLGTYHLVKGLTKDKLSAVVAAVIMALASSFLSKIFFLNFLETIVHIPWLLFAATSINHPAIKVFLVTCLMIIAGHPVGAFYGTMMFIAFTILFHYPHIKKVLFINLSAFAAYLACSIQLLPFLELSKFSVRESLSFEDFIAGKTTLIELAGFLIPTKDWLSNHVDKYIHFGTIAFLALVVSFFFKKKFPTHLRKPYCIGWFFIIIGLFLATLGLHPYVAKVLYQIPLLNLARVSARFIILTHIGAVICIGCFISYLLTVKPKVAKVLSAAIIINSLLIPTIFLDRHEISEGEAQYSPEIKTLIEENTEDQFSLTRPPLYFLSSSLIMFPNRHVINEMHNIIGYNPLLTQDFRNTFPVSPVGSFEDSDYFTTHYENFLKVGIKYYLFPTLESLKENELEEKAAVIDFLKEKGWKELAQDQKQTSIWTNPSPEPFVNFTKKENKIISINFKAGKIELELEMNSPDTLVVKQSFYPGWVLKYDNTVIPADKHQELLQSYEIKDSPQKVTVVYEPWYIKITMILTLIGFSILLLQELYLFNKKK
jgi:hypothetical protein